MKVVIVAGGKGSRIAALESKIPKPMIRIKGVPVLEREIESLRDQGFTDIIITISYLGDVIVNYFGDGSGTSPVTGKPFGVRINYYYEETPLGNAGALFKIRELLKDDFILLNADSLFDVDFKRFVSFHKQKGGLVTLFTHPNSHPYDSALIEVDSMGRVQKWITKDEIRPKFYKNRVNAGLHIISPKILDKRIETPKIDLDEQLLKPLAGTGKMFAYNSPEYVKDMGTPERFYAVCEDIKRGRVIEKNLRNKQRAVFLDRDGTINKYVGFLKNIVDFELLVGVAEAIKILNNSGYLTIVVTNQPVIARGEVSFEELQEIHNKMETLLGDEGAYLDDIFFCPHHPDKGYKGERSEYKVACDCRKPKPGLILKAAEKYNIDLKQSWMVGDSQDDIIAGNAAGCKTVLIGKGEYGQYITEDSLLSFVNREIKER